jgi:hypothetical protein
VAPVASDSSARRGTVPHTCLPCAAPCGVCASPSCVLRVSPLHPAGEQPRVLGAKLIIERVPDMAGDGPVVLVGDFNAGVWLAAGLPAGGAWLAPCVMGRGVTPAPPTRPHTTPT